ncbi:PLP-dependent aminotransferase family protein [Acinetobacter sp. ME22]|uniref:MocR-like pyridoxine biosynthesis transcription factor PdxR n=1 Tax=Acinetobacter sp. ME22 TaxID=2904802 RepID=UPI001EDC6B8D|nr:PLP-dependent aminotransferase family protein [Acinetobacter sp. ME22]MCG2574773.1 PLP-dependent aminotransferase family protein [Acinetobacter sp. ME22]
MRNLFGDYLLLTLHQDTNGKLHQRLCRCLRKAIIEGVIQPKTRLPASRDLANELNISRNTILAAYEQLRAEGYLETRIGHGTLVVENIPESYLSTAEFNQCEITRKVQSSFSLSQRGFNLLEFASAPTQQWGAFFPGTPDVTEFPHHIFSQIQAKLIKTPDIDQFLYSQIGGCFELRSALVDYLRVTRSVKCDVDQIIITEGIHQAIDLLSRTLCDMNDPVWIEEPAYWGIRNILRINGLDIKPIPVDSEGIIPIENPEQSPKLIFITPSHQYPLGSHLSLDRRKKLIQIARKNNSWIVEDDYDSEFRFSGQPYPSLQGLEKDSPVIYMGTFSKTIYPSLRIGYIVVPKSLFLPLHILSTELYRGGHLIEQKALAEFIREGHYEAHIRRMRLLYGKRREFLISLIHRYLGKEFVHEYNDAAGLHLVLKLPNACDDVAVSINAKKHGIYLRPLSQYYMYSQTTAHKGLLLGFACVSEKDTLVAFGILLQCLREEGIATIN